MTIVFKNSITAIRHFWSQIQAFQLFTKFRSFTNSRVLISSMPIVFLYSGPKTPKLSVFGPKFRHFHFFKKFYNLTNSGELISNMTIVVLKFLAQNNQIRHFWSQIQAFLFFYKILQSDIFEGVDFKYSNSFLKFQSKDT